MKNVYSNVVMLILSMFLLSGCLPTLFAGAASSTLAFAKDRRAVDTLTDVRILTAIKGVFIKNNFRNLYSKIKIEVVQGRVLYTGSIEKDEDAITAVQIAWNQEGVVEVINELKVDKNSNKFNIVQYTRDALITSQIKSKTFMNREIKFVNYTAITLNDVVYLFGIARSEEELEKVASIASNISGVKKVVSHVKVQELARKIKSSANKADSTDTNYLLDQGEELTLENISNDW
jgi:osmotically-inducible protein OsmY